MKKCYLVISRCISLYGFVGLLYRQIHFPVTIIDNPGNQIICIVFFLNDIMTTKIYAYSSKFNDLLISLEYPDLENAGGRGEIQVSKMCMHLLTLKTTPQSRF